MVKSSDIIPGRKVYIIGHGPRIYANWTQSLIVDHMEDATYCLLTGGSDVSSHLYGRAQHPTTYSSPERDEYEVKEFNRARDLGLPLLGTCRGAQFLCCQAGGILCQDIGHQPYMHKVTTFDGLTIRVTSTHHQLAHPWDLPADQFKVLAWSVGLSAYHYGQSDDEELVIGNVPGNHEAESVYYPHIKALGHQGHPEELFDLYQDGHADAVASINWHRMTLNKLLDGTL